MFNAYPLHILDGARARLLLGAGERVGDGVKDEFVRDARRLNVAAVGRPVCAYSYPHRKPTENIRH